MKNILTSILVLGSLLLNAQSFNKTFNSADKTWLGIDYSVAKFVGRDGFKNPSDLNRLMRDWNNFVYKEPSKYDLKKAFHDNVSINIDQTEEKNADLDGYEMVQDKNHTIDEEAAIKAALSYDYSKIEGVGIILITECYNKTRESGSYWLVVVDASNKDVIFTKKYMQKPGGFGIRNFWAKTFHGTLIEIEKDLYTNQQ